MFLCKYVLKKIKIASSEENLIKKLNVGQYEKE